MTETPLTLEQFNRAGTRPVPPMTPCDETDPPCVAPECPVHYRQRPRPLTRELAQEIAGRIARLIGVLPHEMFVADHRHEELREGAWSIAYEGYTAGCCWPCKAADIEQDYPLVHFEPLASWALALYPVEDER